MISAAKIIAALERHGITHVLGVPDNGSCVLYERLWEHDTIEVILTSREGEAYGLASGLYLGGAYPLVLIQNTGFLEAGDALRGTAYNMGIPLVMLVGYRGYATMAPGAPSGRYSRHLLRADSQGLEHPLHRHAHRRRLRPDRRRVCQGPRDLAANCCVAGRGDCIRCSTNTPASQN